MVNRALPWLRFVSVVLGAYLGLQILSLPFTGVSLRKLQAPNMAFNNTPSTNRVDLNARIGKAVNNLPGPIATRSQLIRQSELFGPVPRPQPIGLSAVFDNIAIISFPSGDRGPLKVGEERNGVQLLEVAANRALIVHEGATNELTIFSGIGSDSILKR